MRKSGKVSTIAFREVEMSGPARPSIDQLDVFLSVAETGSFAAAGRRLRRATSAISYAIANLESQLGVSLFDREQTRKPQLTEAGLAVLAEAKIVANSIDNLRAKVKGILSGLESEVTLVVDVMLPTERLVDAMLAFEAEFPTVTLRLHVEALGAVIQRVHENSADVGICGGLHINLPGLEQVHVGGVDLIPVAARSHPLAKGDAATSLGAARNHTQLVLTDRSSLTAGQDYAVIAIKSWRLADLGSKHALLLAGVGWGNMPEPMVRDDLANGRLVRLELPEWAGGFYQFQAIHRTDTPPRPAAAWMIRRFLQQSQLNKQRTVVN
jgi:DNA-binding transcriptional LysR family regulator